MENVIDGNVEEGLVKFVDMVTEIKTVQDTGEIYVKKFNIWSNRCYGWENMNYPVEYRRYCLHGGTFKYEQMHDVYYLMVQFFEQMTGKRIPYDFKHTSYWEVLLRRKIRQLDIDMQEAIVKLIDDGTKVNCERRIRSVDELIGMEEYQKIYKTVENKKYIDLPISMYFLRN